MLSHASHVLVSWPAWRRRLAFARGRRAHICRATPYGCPRGRCAPTVARKCATDSNPRKRDTRSSPDRGTCAMRVSSHRRAKTHNSPRVVPPPSCWQSTQNDAERRRATSPSCRSSSKIMSESGSAGRRSPRGTGSAGHTQCPRGAQERPRRPRLGGCGSGGGFGGVASRRRLARWGALGAWASGRATRRPSEVTRGLRGVTWVLCAFCSVLCFSHVRASTIAKFWR